MSKLNKKLFICFICVLTCTFLPKQVNATCPEHDFQATVMGTITETYAVYTYLKNPYAYCYYCKNYPSVYLGYPYAGDYHPGIDCECGCCQDCPPIDHTACWYGVYKITDNPIIKTDYRDVTIEFNGTVNHGDNPSIATALDLGPAIPPAIYIPLHDRKVWDGPPENWYEEVSLSLSFDAIVIHTNPDVTVAFSSPPGSTTTTNPAAHVLAWKPDNDCECLAGLVWLDTGYMHTGKLGYSIDEDDFLYFISSGYVYTYNISAGQWGIDVSGVTYFDWPFVYSAEAGSWLYVYPPADGLHVYHNNTGQWCVLPQTFP